MISVIPTRCLLFQDLVFPLFIAVNYLSFQGLMDHQKGFSENHLEIFRKHRFYFYHCYSIVLVFGNKYLFCLDVDDTFTGSHWTLHFDLNF